MRTRRDLIRAGGAAAVLGASGCLEEVPEDDNETDDGDVGGNETGGEGNQTDGTDSDDEGEMDGGADDEEEQDNETDTDEEPAAPSFGVVSVEAPSAAEIGTTVDWSVTVENSGDADGTFETTVVSERGGSEETVEEVSVGIPAGEERSYSSSVRHDFVGDYTYTVGETGEGFVITAEMWNGPFGEGYANPDDVSVTVTGTRRFSDMELSGSYSYVDADGERSIVRAGNESVFAMVRVEARKESRDVVDMPRRDEFTMFVGDDAYDPVDRFADDEYSGGETRSRGVSGVLMFEVDEELERTDGFEVYWTRDYDDGRAEATWTT